VEINVIDAIMGAGKSTFIIDMLRKTTNPSTRYLVIVPTLAEIARMRLALQASTSKSLETKSLESEDTDQNSMTSAS
jgi:G3E family GTPase